MIYEDAYERLSRARLIDIDGDVFIRQMDAVDAMRINPNRIKPVAENMGGGKASISASASCRTWRPCIPGAGCRT